MFGALGRYMRAFWYLITGRVDSARKQLSKNPYVVQATFDQIIQDKKRDIHRYKEAVAAMITQQEKKLQSIKRLTDETTKLERLKEGAAAKAKSLVEKLKSQGIGMEEIKKNEEYQKCLTAFNDFTSTLNEKSDHIVDLESDVGGLGGNIANHKVQLQQMLREIDKLKAESSATVADIITATEEEKIADMLSGISDDRFSKELQDMRELREQTKSEARVSRELAGTDTKRQEAEFLEYATHSVASDEFDRLIGLADEADRSAEETSADKSRSKLPEE